jgi:hypothetical protein
MAQDVPETRAGHAQDREMAEQNRARLAEENARLKKDLQEAQMQFSQTHEKAKQQEQQAGKQFIFLLPSED